MENVTVSSVNLTDRVSESGITIDRIIICVVFYIIVLITILGNVMVLVAIKTEKRLQTLFNYYIVNLAVTDIAVAATAMSFYTLDVTLGYWPFGELMCAFWVFCDYGMTFASVFTLIAISVDRFWSVTWSLHYRTHHTRRKCLVIILVIWVCMLILWLPACVTDRIKNSQPRVCIWEPSLNKEFVVVIAVLGHHGAFTILMFCYIRVLMFMRNRRVNPVIRRQTERHLAPESFSYRESTVVNVSSVSDTINQNIPDSGLRTVQLNSARANGNNVTALPDVGDPDSRPTQSDHANSVKSGPIPNKASSGGKERKAFVTMTYIIMGYVICWLPFHIVFDVSSIAPDKVSDTVFTITFWMTYLNSTINPILYNFSSKEFRQAFVKILTLKCLKEQSQ